MEKQGKKTREKMKKHAAKGPVYSTETGRTCPACGQALVQCCCRREVTGQHGDGVVRVGRETKGRKGSGVCLITGLELAGPELKKLARQLKQKCGAGGTVKNGIIEIQGDHGEALVQALIGLGFKAKRAGG